LLNHENEYITVVSQYNAQKVSMDNGNSNEQSVSFDKLIKTNVKHMERDQTNM